MPEVAQRASHASNQPSKVIGGNGLDAARMFFGPTAGLMEPSGYDKVQYTHYDLPEALRGNSMYIRDVVTGLVLGGEQWYTTLALPWGETDQIEVEWNEWHMGRGLAGRVPHEGISRLITSSKQSRNARVIRRGIAFVMEADFLRTREGLQHYERNLIGLANTVQVTANSDTVFAIVTAHTAEMRWHQKFGTSRISIQALIDEENANYASACSPDPTQTRLSFIVNNHREAMSMEGADAPDLMILGPGMRAYLPRSPPEHTMYYVAGPSGTLELKDGPEALMRVQGMNVVETDYFAGDDDTPTVNLLARTSQIGETYPNRLGPEWREASGYNFSRRSRNRKIFDENADRMVEISFKDMFKHTHLFGEDKKINPDLARLIESYNDRGVVAPGADAGPFGEHAGAVSADGVHRRPMNAPPHFLAVYDAENNPTRPWKPVERFGQLSYASTTSDDVARIAESIASGVETYNAQAIARLRQLIHQIEAQPYDPAFVAALIRTNMPRSIDNKNNFTGELTPGDLAEHWNQPQIREWRPNQYGGLDLPRTDDTKTMRFPMGYANAPGLRTLAAEASRADSPWHQAGIDARDGIIAVDAIVQTLLRTLPKSAALDARGRAPWFHQADPLAVFISNITAVSRDPLFLMHLPVARGDGADDGGGDVIGTTSGAGASASAASEELRWPVVPGTYSNVASPGTLSDEFLSAILETTRNGGILPDDSAFVDAVEFGRGSGAGDPTVMAFYPSLNRAVGVPTVLFSKNGALPREIQVIGTMPSGDGAAAKMVRASNATLLGELGPAGQNNKVALAKYMEFVLLMATRGDENLWQFVVGLARDIGDVLGVLDRISVFSGSTLKQRDDARAQIAQTREIGVGAIGEAGAVELRGSEPLYKVWQELYPSRALGSDTRSTNTADLGGWVTEMMDQEVIISDYAAQAGVEAPNFSGPNSTGPAAVARAERTVAAIRASPSVSAVDVAGAAAAAALLRTNANRIARAISGTTPGAGLGYPRGIVIDTSPDARAQGRYYRSPLTASHALIQSMSDRFSDTVGVLPLALPGDGVTNLYPYMGDGGAYIVPASVWDRSSYRTASEFQSTDFSRRASMTTDDSGSSSAFGFESKAQATSSSDFSFDDNFSGDLADMDAVFDGGGKRARTFGAHSGSSGRGGAHATAMTSDSAESLTFSHTETFNRRWADTDDISHPLERMCARAFLLTPANDEGSWLAMIDNDAIVPINIDIWRLFIEHLMSSLVLMKGGYDTGANLHGHKNFSTSVDNVAKTMYGNLTFYAKAVIWKPKNIHIARDIKPHGYLGGSNTVWAKTPSDFNVSHNNRPSMLAIALPLNEPPAPKLMAFGGYVDEPGLNVDIDGPPLPTYSTYEFNESIWGFADQYAERTSRGDADFVTEAERVTLNAQHGLQYAMNKTTNDFTDVDLGGGPRRKRVYPGCAPVWAGADMSFIEVQHPHTG